MISLSRTAINTVSYHCQTAEETEYVEECLTLRMAGAEFSELKQKGKWDGMVRYYQKGNTFPYGLLQVVTHHLQANDVPYQFDSSAFPAFERTLLYNPALHQHQQEAVGEFFKELFGIIVVPTRGGKTFITGEIIRHLHDANSGERTLFLVDTQDLYLQARTELANYLDMEVGGIQGDEFNIQPVTVAMVQTLDSILSGLKRFKVKDEWTTEETRAKRKPVRDRLNQLKRYIETVTFLVVDECHEYSGKKRTGIIAKFHNADKRLFLSATPYKSENVIANYNLLKVSGREIYRIPEQTLKERGILSRDKILLLYMDHNADPSLKVKRGETLDYRSFVKRVITHNFKRNMTAVNVIEICRKLQLKTLVLFSLKKHGYWLQSITNDTILHGEHDIKERTAAKQKFLQGKGGVLFASTIFNKGITLPQAQVLVNIGGGLEQSGVVQKKGRVLGTAEGKTKSLIVDFIDDFAYFKEHSLSRIQAYESGVLDKNDIYVLNVDDDDFYADLWEFLDDWFSTHR